MHQNWKEVWEDRAGGPHQESTLAQMMALDGMDSGFADTTENVWQQFVRHSAQKMGVYAGASIFEVGCGAGAYLYEYYKQGFRVGGLDSSATLLKHARDAMPSGEWFHGEACDLETLTRYDFVVSCGVFHYFPSLQYAQEVLKRMASKATTSVAVLDVPDRERWGDAMAARRSKVGEEEYDRRYKGLKHLYYSKEWFQSELNGLTKSKIQVEDSNAGWLNSNYRFNVYASR
ncbi:MAG: class I SAM-dependent methyltransferase [Candidatus Acidiferrum sp.]